MTELLTHTKRRDFKNCHRYFYLRHEQRLEPRAQKSGRRRGTAFGKAIFACQQANLDHPLLWDEIVQIADTTVEDCYDDVMNSVTSQQQQDELEIEIAKVQVMAARYVERYGCDRRREVVFEFPLRNPLSGLPMRAFRRAGKIDGLVFYENRQCDVIEDKFTSQITQLMIQRLPLDEQVTEYVDALAELGWTARVRYRHTRLPGINPMAAKEYKTKPDKPAETIAEFKARLHLDVVERPGFYFDEQILLFDRALLERHRLERWVVAKDILAKRVMAGKVGEGAWEKSTSKCLEFGGCQFLPLCEDLSDAIDQYVTVGDNQELGGKEVEGTS